MGLNITIQIMMENMQWVFLMEMRCLIKIVLVFGMEIMEISLIVIRKFGLRKRISKLIESIELQFLGYLVALMFMKMANFRRILISMCIKEMC